MPVIEAVESKAICDVCGEETGAWRSEEIHGSGATVVFCAKCSLRGRLWACKKAFNEQGGSND